METNYFARLNQINVSDHLEKKGEFSYLSWPYAVAQLRLADPAAFWEVRRFDGLPYLKTETGYFVEVAVTVQGVTLSQIHPVLDGKNRPIFEPTAFDINTSHPALPGQGDRAARPRALRLRRRGPARRRERQADAAQGAGRSHHRSPITPAQLRYIERLIDETGSDLGKVLDYFGVAALTELSSHAASRAITSLEKPRRAA